jgi:hypothetical protein
MVFFFAVRIEQTASSVCLAIGLTGKLFFIAE